MLTPLQNELWASWKAGLGARDGYVLKLSGPVESTTTLGPEDCSAVFPGPLPPGHYTLGLKVLAGPYDAWVEGSTWLAGESGWKRAQVGSTHRESSAIGTRVLTFWWPAGFPESAALPRKVPGARLWLDGLEATKQPGRRALLYSADAPGLLGNISVPSGATHIIFCGLVPGAHYRVDITSSMGDITQSITGYTSECQCVSPLDLGLEGRQSGGGIQKSWAEGITGL